MTEAVRAIGSPEDFFEQVVRPNHADFVEHPWCLRRFMNVAISCLSMRDWMFEYGRWQPPIGGSKPVTEREYREYLERKQPLFAELSALANAAKHAVLTQSFRKGLHASEVRVDSFRAGDPVGVPIAHTIKWPREDGRLEPVYFMVNAVVAMWGAEMGAAPPSEPVR